MCPGFRAFSLLDRGRRFGVEEEDDELGGDIGENERVRVLLAGEWSRSIAIQVECEPRDVPSAISMIACAGRSGHLRADIASRVVSSCAWSARTSW